jgi:hypothetical protein
MLREIYRTEKDSPEQDSKDTYVQQKKPKRFVIGPDGFLYPEGTTNQDFDKRFYRR